MANNTMANNTLEIAKQVIDQLYANGFIINPQASITPESLNDFVAQATKEIDPYYVNQLKTAKDSFLTSLGYAKEDLARQEADAEKRYGVNLRTLGESAAEQGFAQSGIRQRAESDLAQETQQSLDESRRQLSRGATSVAQQFAQQFGTNQLGQGPLVGAEPRVLAGQASFQQDTRQLPLYNISDDVYKGLTGTQQFQERADIQNRARQLESAQRQRTATPQPRTLSL